MCWKTYSPRDMIGDLEILKDFSEFSGLSPTEVAKGIQEATIRCRQEWENLPGDTFESKASIFYGQSKNYIYDLLSANHSKKGVIRKMDYFNPLILYLLKEHVGRKFLDFGGGTGVMCEIAYEVGKLPSYLDIPGYVADFAQWRFKKRNLPIKTIISSPENFSLSEDFDIIFSDAVFEHLVSPERAVNELCRHITNNGLFILLIDLSGQTAEMPMHRDVDVKGIHSMITENGFMNILGKNTFCSVWQKER